MKDEKEEQRKEKRKKLDEKLYRNFCRTKFYRWISLGEKKQAQREATLSIFFYYLPLFRSFAIVFLFFFTVFSNERIYFGQKPNCPEFAYPWLMESPVFLKLEKREKELGEKWEDTRTKNMKFVEGATVNSRRKEKMKKESEEKMCICTWWSVIHGTKAVREIPLLKIK